MPSSYKLLSLRFLYRKDKHRYEVYEFTDPLQEPLKDPIDPLKEPSKEPIDPLKEPLKTPDRSGTLKGTL